MNCVRKQALQVALYATWFAGLLCILISLRATQLLPRLMDQKSNIDTRGTLKITFFTVPAPFEGIVGAIQEQAIHSWLLLSPNIQVVLFGTHPSLVSFAERMHGRVFVESDIDFTFSHSPLFNSVILRAQSSTSDISVLIDPQFMLIKDFIETIEYVNTLQHSWLLAATAKSQHDFPYELNLLKDCWINEGQCVAAESIRTYVQNHGEWQSCTGRYLWAWSTENVPFHIGVLPSFVYGYGFHNEWLLNEALLSGLRFVFDASEAVMAFYHHLEVDHTIHRWEEESNAHLAALYGAFNFRPSNYVNMPTKLVRDKDHRSRSFHFSYPLDGSCEVGNSTLNRRYALESYYVSKQQQSQKHSFITSVRSLGYRIPLETKENNKENVRLKKLATGRLGSGFDCRNNIEEARLDCPSSKMKKQPSIRLANGSTPGSLESLLAEVADVNKVVVVSVVANNYRDMLMNWVCRLRKLQVTNFIVGAIDMELYEFAISQGLPVFMIDSNMKPSFNDCHFGTDCFKKVTKMKSRTVLYILRLGYTVLFSDVDVYWFENPIPYLMSFGPRTMVVQSDEWNATEPLNKPRRLNSGFYFAWPDVFTTAVFEKIVKHAADSNMSEQPSFYDVLCGLSGKYRVGNAKCMEPETNVTTYFLDRNLFPNGGFNDLWSKRNVNEACILQGCIVLHNNWVSGRQRKFSRQISSGLWDYDDENRICMRSWFHQKIGP